MSLYELKLLWCTDLYRYSGRADLRAWFKYFLISEGYKYSFYVRLCRYLASANCRVLARPLYLFFMIILRRYQYKFGISIYPSVEIGSGLYIGHFGGIVVNDRCSIGKNCNISHDVTIGESYRGAKQGIPTIGDKVFIGPGAKIFGGVRIGNNVAIGANCVVTHDVPDNAVVAGIPAKIISFKGSDGYINRTDYEAIHFGPQKEERCS
jgi:serine O-acetyltransferase